jgi:SAM-dependent methyltransferase
MGWRGSQADSRNRYLAKFDAAEADRYDASVGRLSRLDEDAYLSDLARVVQFREGMAVLDAGAGTGALCKILARLPGLTLTALEPAPAMLARLRGQAELRGVAAAVGFCDAVSDRAHFRPAQFDAIASRQLVNGLFDPLAAFTNWRHWLSPGGVAVVIDGLYDRSAWAGVWQEEVDVLPLSASRSMAAMPYLLEVAGFQVEAVRMMEAVNALPSTRTRRFVVVARKPVEPPYGLSDLNKSNADGPSVVD